ncbi:MAG: RDD family protein [Proteobacteria bacterium]|nr:RDD family protein [Pseudomonadota bacterium]
MNTNYAGFWIRTLASMIDTVLMLIIIIPVMSAIYGDAYWDPDTYYLGLWDGLFNYILPAIAIILFWFYKSATPGKMITHLIIVDAKTGEKPSVSQLIIRYIGYYVSAIPLLLGLFWVGIDKRKQGWHDKMAGTVVVETNT